MLITFTGHLPAISDGRSRVRGRRAALSFVWRATGADPLVAFRQPPKVWLITIAAFLGYHACLYNAVQKAPATPAALLQGCPPLLIVFGSALLPGERLRSWHVLGAMAGLVGVAALVLGDGATQASQGNAGFYLAVVGLAAAL
jgi:drug/metabolite transporter (DMT)-like permease